MTIALVDGDLIAYRCAASCEKKEKGEVVSLEPVEIAIARADKLVREILHDTGAEEYKVFLSGGNNFRYEVNPMYKANRVAEDPIHRDDVKTFLIQEWNAIVTDGYEADDALGIHQSIYPKILDHLVSADGKSIVEESSFSIICSLDKDLLMIPGQHYSWQISGTSVNGKQWVREAKFTNVSELDGLKTFYKQMLIGDVSDNVIGVRGIGEVKAAKLIDPLQTEEGMFGVVHQLYSDHDRFYMNADCLWIMQEEGVKYSDRKKNVHCC